MKNSRAKETTGVQLRICLFGGLEISRANGPIPMGAYRGSLIRRLLRRLLADRGARVSTDSLGEDLWPDDPPRDPLNSIQQAVYKARRVVGTSDLIRFVDGGYVFIEDDRCTVDLEDFTGVVREGSTKVGEGLLEKGLSSLLKALDLWRGEPLVEDAEAPWARNRRDDLIRLRQEAARGAAHAAVTICDSRALGIAGDAVAIDSLSEAANLLLIRSLVQSGERARALHAFEAFRRRLADELGTDPSAEAQAIQMSLLRGEPLPPLPAISRLTSGALRRLSPFALATLLGS